MRKGGRASDGLLVVEEGRSAGCAVSCTCARTSFIRDSRTAPKAGSASPPPPADGEYFSTSSAMSPSRFSVCCMQATTFVGTDGVAIVATAAETLTRSVHSSQLAI